MYIYIYPKDVQIKKNFNNVYHMYLKNLISEHKQCKKSDGKKNYLNTLMTLDV